MIIDHETKENQSHIVHCCNGNDSINANFVFTFCLLDIEKEVLTINWECFCHSVFDSFLTISGKYLKIINGMTDNCC